MLGKALRRRDTRSTRIFGGPAPSAATGVGSDVCTGADGGVGSAGIGDAGGYERAAVWLPFYVCRRASCSIYYFSVTKAPSKLTPVPLVTPNVPATDPGLPSASPLPKNRPPHLPPSRTVAPR